jgi:ankyrin repeat protein
MSERIGAGQRQSKALTPWHAAVRAADIKIVRKMLESGTDINALDEHGQTALMNAVYWGSLELAKLLVESGADLNRTAKLNLTALYLAVINNRPNFVRLLVDAGADASMSGSAKSSFSCSPLDYARQQGSAEIVRILEGN